MWGICTKVCWICTLVILLLGSITSAQGATLRFHAFAGTWFAHGSSLQFSEDGQAIFQGRTYRWCGPGVVPPCDSIDARNVIHAGNQEQIRFSRIANSGSIAYGTIIASNFHPRGLAVTVELRPDHTLLYASHTPIALLCSPAAPVGMCGA